MGYAILRVAKRTHNAGAAMAQHALRDGHKEVANAIDGGKPPEVLEGATSSNELMATVATLKAAAIAGGQRWRKDQVEVVDLLVTTSRQDMATWSLDQQNSYFRDAITFIKKRWPHAKILTAAVHRDETTPHVQVLMAPLDDRGRFAAKRLLGGPSDMSKLQDDYHASVGAPRGLERGEKGSKATHVPVRVFYAHAAAVEVGKAEALEDVPPAPVRGWKTVLDGSYKKAQAEREAIIQRNAKRIKTVQRERLQLRAMHPSQIERQASKYRANKALEDVLKKERDQITVTKNEITQERELITKTKRDIEHATNEIQKQAQSADALWTKAGGQLLDKSSKRWSPEYVQQVSRALGIPLTPGKGVIDQMRAAGRGRTLIESAKILDNAMDGAMTRQIDSGEAQRSIDRQRST